ncbi:type VI secretion system Vgr family protein [Cupriavidus oxalaticus]|uniref:type VI secretion system Vgr family protein n=1 Tax=Cupriavidus oxalaticus TaxID=96344 RepID=UPI003F73C207
MGHHPPFLASRTVTLRGERLPQILGQVALTVSRVQGTEGLNSLFTYTVEVKTPDELHRRPGPAANLDLAAMQGKELTLEIELDGAGTGLAGHLGAGVREITGIVTQVEGPRPDERHYVYRLTLRPWLFLATLTSDFKVFQQKTVVEILQDLLADYSFPVENRLDVARYPTREYQVQHGETDFAFFERLTQEWGISYFFEHVDGHHRLVLTDGNGAFRRFASPAYHTLSWRPSADRADAEHLYGFHVQDQLVSGKWTSTDHDFVKPRADLSVASHDPRDTAHAEGEVYDYPGDHAQPATGNDPWREGDLLARIRMETIRQHGSRVWCQGNVRAVVPGCTFTLKGFAQAAANREYLVFGTMLDLEEVAEASGAGQQWRCEVEFQAQSTASIFRPERTRPKPRTYGPQTATVVGPETEQVWVDAFGRIKLQLHWDRIGRRDANSSCWVQVSQAWQGDQFGASHIPRIGQEVIVAFTHGDPDCPIVTGRMPNRVNLPAWVLPGQHALSGFRSKELSGERHNTFVQDDTQGEIQTQLGSDHQASLLSLGYITRIPGADGRRDKRGEGFELRTDGWGAMSWPLGERDANTVIRQVQPLIHAALRYGAFALPGGLASDYEVPGGLPAITTVTDEQLKSLHLVATANASFLRMPWQIVVTPRTIETLLSTRDPAQRDIAQKMLADALYHEARHCQQEFWMMALMQQFPQDYARVPHMQEFYREFSHKEVFKLAAKLAIPNDPLVLRGLHRMLVGHYYWMLAGLREGRLEYRARNPGAPLFGDAFYDAELQAARQFAYDLLQTVGAGGVSINVDTMVKHETGYRAQLHEDDAFICGEAVQSYWDSRDGTPLLRNPGACTREFSEAAGGAGGHSHG